MDLSLFSLDERARQALNQMMSRGARHRLLNKLTGKSQNLIAFDDLREQMTLSNQHDKGIQTVAIKQIIGSLGRVNDFDNEFHLMSEDLQQRWLAIAKAHYSGRELPPIEVYEVEAHYYVIDGNHRVSVMKTIGQDYIEAHVIELHQTDARCQTQELPAPRIER